MGPDVAIHYDAAGRMSDITTNGGETIVAFNYDDANRKLWEDQTVIGYPTHRVQTDPDADGNRTNLQVPGWYLIRYDYTQRNQLWHIYQGDSTPWFNYTYDLAGNMIKRQDAYAGVNDSTNASYDALNRPTMWEQTGPADAFLARSWQQYDNANRLTATWRDEQGSKGERFGYNPRNQLTSVSYNADQVWTGIPLNSTRDVSYTMDPLNRQSMTDSTEGVTNYSPNALNQYESIDGAVNSYDGNFNFAGTGGFWANYDSENHLFWAYSGEDYGQFVDDGLGRCLKRTINWETTLIAYDGWKPIVEWDVWDGQIYFEAWNIYGAGQDEILWRYADRYGHLRYHLDRMGNIAFVLDLDGAVREKYTYDAFGRPIVSDWDGGNPRSWSWYGNRFMFTGREWIPELGLYDYRNRFYHPLLGRFLQVDPKGFDAGDMNLFRYVGDDPVDKEDPMGLAAVPHMGYYDQPLFLPDYFRPQTPALTMGVIVPEANIAKEWKQTKPELMKDPVMRKIINRLERPDVIVHLYRTNDPVSAATFDKGNRVFWNPSSAIKSKADGTWRASPAVALGHELDHTYLKITNPLGYFNNSHATDSQYRTAEERRVITRGAEASMMNTFYHANPRTDYDFYPYPVASPLDR
ncbi:MAG: hypothetical protein V7609_998 [Verrucomicrobiota bacterium]